MLKLASNGGAVINTDDFYIYHKSNGLDELIFNLSIYDENYKNIIEEAVIEYKQPYLVKAIDGGGSTAKIKCQINLDELKSTLNPTYSNNSATLQDTIENVLPEGWALLDYSLITIKRTIEGAYTPYDVIMQCPETYGIVLQFDVKLKQVKTYSLDNFQPLGAFVTRDLNLKELNYKGKSTDFYTRLYAYGKDGLSFADINDGKPYVDCNTYTDKIVCAVWKDDRYEIPENLMQAAQELVIEAGNPVRSYECTVVDLAKTNPDLYGFQDFKMFTVVKLIDDIKNVSVNYQVVEYWEYPYYPEKNIVTLSSATPKIQNTVQSISKEINNQTSQFWTGLSNAINAATSIITGVNGGYVVINSNSQGQPYEILIMDTPDISTAVNVWRWNQGGLGHSSNGYNGPYETAITQDGQIVANFIETGTMSANRISGGTLSVGGMDGNSGSIAVYNASGDQIGTWDENGFSTSGTYCAITQDGSVYSNQPIFMKMYMCSNVSGSVNASQMESRKNLVLNIVNSVSGIYGSGYSLEIAPDDTTNTQDYIYVKIGGKEVDVSGNMKVSGNFSVSGTKNRRVKTQNYSERLLYSYETSSPLFGDIGTGFTDESGECYIEINDIFSETVSGKAEYYVFLQKESEGDLFVKEKNKKYFVVSGSPNAKFDWEIKAKQTGYENERMEDPEKADANIYANYKTQQIEKILIEDNFLFLKKVEEMHE